MTDVPRGMIRLRDGRVVHRRHGWLVAGERLKCPHGHHVTPSVALHEGAITVVCRQRPELGHAMCGSLFYLATGAMGLFWADITEAEDREIKQLEIRPTGVARYLGIQFPE